MIQINFASGESKNDSISILDKIGNTLASQNVSSYSSMTLIEIVLDCENYQGIDPLEVSLSSIDIPKLSISTERIDPCIFKREVQGGGSWKILVNDSSVKIKNVYLGNPSNDALVGNSNLFCGSIPMFGSFGSCKSQSISRSLGCTYISPSSRVSNIRPELYLCSSNFQHQTAGIRDIDGNLKYRLYKGDTCGSYKLEDRYKKQCKKAPLVIDPKNHMKDQCIRTKQLGFIQKVCERYIVWRDGKYQLINNIYELAQHMLPIDSEEKAFMYVQAVTGLSELRNNNERMDLLKPRSANKVESYVTKLDDGSFKVVLYDWLSSGDEESISNSISDVVMRVSGEGVISGYSFAIGRER